MSRPSRRTLSVDATLTMMPFVPETRTPASTPVAIMLIDFVIVNRPKLPGSRTLISPPAAVFEMVPANVLQGAVRLHGLASSPTPDTHVRDACAWAGSAFRHMATVPIAMANKTTRRMSDTPFERWESRLA